MKVFFANCKYENWPSCKANKIFGLKGKRLPDLSTGDLILLRLTGHSGKPYGVKSIWILDSVEQVRANTFVPWKDGEYNWILHCTILAEFTQPLSEEFATSSKISQKIDSFYATRLMGSIGELKPIEAIAYLELILSEKSNELYIPFSSTTKEESITVYLDEVIKQLRRDVGYSPKPSTDRTIFESFEVEEKPPSFGIVGERIDLPVLNYAPLNEMGVILLFGYYLRDLGFSHLEEIRAGFPDAIGMQKVDERKYRRVRIEFEFKSRNFITHDHRVEDCDVIICWEDNWADCPLEVIELKSALFQND